MFKEKLKARVKIGIVLLACVSALFLAAGLVHSEGYGERDKPSASVGMDHFEHNNTAHLTYLTTDRNPIFAENVTISSPAGTTHWNGETDRGVIEKGSVHTVRNVSSGDEIVITVSSNDYPENSTIQMQIP